LRLKAHWPSGRGSGFGDSISAHPYWTHGSQNVLLAACLPGSFEILLTLGSGSPENSWSRGCGARGDLGQLAPRKKLLKSLTSFPELSETLLALFGTEGFLFPSALPSFAYDAIAAAKKVAYVRSLSVALP